jgi:hypothetical protein
MISFLRRNGIRFLALPKRSWKIAYLCRKFTAQNNTCAWCGKVGKVDAHHIIPVWADPTLAEDPTNLIPLCSDDCHLLIGHAGSYSKKYVRNVKELCQLRNIVHRQIQGETVWQTK